MELTKCETCNREGATGVIHIPLHLKYPHVAAVNTINIDGYNLPFSEEMDEINVCPICLNKIMAPLWDLVKEMREKASIGYSGERRYYEIYGGSQEEVRINSKILLDADWRWEPMEEPRPYFGGIWTQRFHKKTD